MDYWVVFYMYFAIENWLVVLEKREELDMDL